MYEYEANKMYEGKKVFEITLDKIVAEPGKMQSRHDKATDIERVRIYAEMYRNGVELPPLTVVKLDGVYTISDGFHRYEALKQLAGREGAISVFVALDEESKSVDEAKWKSIEANMKHGKPLKTADFREAFRVYMRLRKHWKEARGKRIKRYVEIAEELQGVSDKTLRKWMKQDFPQVYERMAREFKTSNPHMEQDEYHEALSFEFEMNSAYRQQQEALRLFDQGKRILEGIAMKDYKDEGLVEAAKIVIEAFKTKGRRKPEVNKALKELEKEMIKARSRFKPEEDY